MTTFEERERLQRKYLQMAKRFGWNMNQNANCVNINDNMPQPSASVENDSFILSTPIPQQKQNSNSNSPLSNDNNSNSPSPNRQMSAFLIDNHIRHCQMQYEQKQSEQQSSPSAPSPNNNDSNQDIMNGLNISCIPAQSSNHNGILDLCSSDDDEDDGASNISVIQSQKLEFDDSFCTQSPIIDQNRRNNHNHHHFNRTPLLIRQERRRIEQQQRRDHEFAMNLQREMEREQQQQSLQQQQQHQNSYQQIVQMVQDANIPQMRQHIPEMVQQLAQLRQEYNDQNGVNDVDVSNLSYDALLEMFPNEAHGASEETIRRLPTDRFHKNGCNVDANDDKNKCMICLEQFNEGDEIRRLQCLHIFHKDEIDQWLRHNRECPICRINVEEHQ